MSSIFKDPVCGMTVRADKALSAFYQERKIHFCSEFCRYKFFEHPERYATALVTNGYDEAKDNRQIAYSQWKWQLGLLSLITVVAWAFCLGIP